MKTLIYFLVLSSFICFSDKTLAASALKSLGEKKPEQRTSFPQIVEIHGAVDLRSLEFNGSAEKGVTSLKYKKGQVLTGSLTLITPAEAQARIQIDESRLMIVLPQSHVLVPSVDGESGRIREINIKYGQVRFIQTKTDQPLIQIFSEVFSQDWTPGDFILSYNPQKSLAEATNLASESLTFSAVNAEEKVILGKNQKAQFQGLQAEGELQYDILLKGRKIPRGTLGAAVDLSESETKSLDLVAEAQKRAQAEALRQKILREKNKRKPDEICDSPRGKLNMCAWGCFNSNSKNHQSKSHKKSSQKSGAGSCSVDNQSTPCARRRCLASGEWGDEYVLPLSEAKLKCSKSEFSVGVCDY